jgi:phage terminase large subunit-like protein
LIKGAANDPVMIDQRQRLTDENRANLAPGFFNQVIRKYESTRLGRQELEAEILDDVPGALWNRTLLEEQRWPAYHAVPEFRRVVVAIDPAVTSGEEADETGVIRELQDFRVEYTVWPSRVLKNADFGEKAATNRIVAAHRRPPLGGRRGCRFVRLQKGMAEYCSQRDSAPSRMTKIPASCSARLRANRASVRGSRVRG